MHHRYIIATSGKQIDADRAGWLMDRQLVDDARKAMLAEHLADSDPDALCNMQRLWDEYCRRHREKYGEGFPPDVDSDWGG